MSKVIYQKKYVQTKTAVTLTYNCLVHKINVQTEIAELAQHRLDHLGHGL